MNHSVDAFPSTCQATKETPRCLTDGVIHPIPAALLSNPIQFRRYRQSPIPFGPMSSPPTLFLQPPVSFMQLNNMLSTCLSREDYGVADGTELGVGSASGGSNSFSTSEGAA
mmetsp:Transcript_2967/g.3250  ORF Transcript_2967/g.3250 Transcript_2967/m.3250 type:complete len:112 (-) Transcript_2967:1064-1399(-)